MGQCNKVAESRWLSMATKCIPACSTKAAHKGHKNFKQMPKYVAHVTLEADSGAKQFLKPWHSSNIVSCGLLLTNLIQVG